MKYYLTLVAKEENNNLSQEALDKVTKLLNERHIEISTTNELAEKICSEFLISGVTNTKFLTAEVRNLLNEYEIDVFLIEEDLRKIKKLLIADMDSTIIQNECIDEIARYAGKYEEVSRITEAAMSGKIPFEDSLTGRVRSLKGVTTSCLEKIFSENITLSKGAITLGKTLKKFNCNSVVASGGFTFFTSKVKNLISFDQDYANTLEFVENQLTGELIPPIFGSQSKLETTLKLITELNISSDEVIAVGDGANDIPMLTSINLGVAYKAKWAVREKLLNQINFTDLTSLLYIQGIAKKDFAS